MRNAPAEALRDDVRPALTAHISEADLDRLFPVQFVELDSLAAPEPSCGALLRLDTGSLVLVEYGKLTSTLTVSVPKRADVGDTLVDLLMEVPINPQAIEWMADEWEAPSEAFATDDAEVLAGELRRTFQKKRKSEAGKDTQTRLEPRKVDR